MLKAQEHSDLNSTDPDECRRGKCKKYIKRKNSTSSTNSDEMNMNRSANLELEISPSLDLLDEHGTSITFSTENEAYAPKNPSKYNYNFL